MVSRTIHGRTVTEDTQITYCPQCQIQATAAADVANTTNVSVGVLALLLGVAIVGIYYLSKGK
jgi:hypothetical protein